MMSEKNWKIAMDQPTDFETAKTRHMEYKSLIEKANYEEIIGKLVPMDSIISYLETVGGQLKTSLHQIPDRLASRLTFESDEGTIHELIMSEIEEVYRQVATCLNTERVKTEIKKSGKKPLIKGGRVSGWYK